MWDKLEIDFSSEQVLVEESNISAEEADEVWVLTSSITIDFVAIIIISSTLSPTWWWGLSTSKAAIEKRWSRS